MQNIRIFAAVSCLLFATVAMAQVAAPPKEGSNWQRVQQLPLHTKVHVSADSKSRVCTIDKIDEDKLDCTAGRVVQSSHYTFQRSEIKSIEVTRYILSTAVGAGIGAGVGAITGEIVKGRGGFFSTGEAVGVGVALFGIPGAILGGVTDLARGPTVYRRP